MTLGLLSEDMEILDVAQDIINKVWASSPDPCEPVKLGDCGSTCIGSCSGTCWTDCIGSCKGTAAGA